MKAIGYTRAKEGWMTEWRHFVLYSGISLIECSLSVAPVQPPQY
jgi:hypothetical protein